MTSPDYVFDKSAFADVTSDSLARHLEYLETRTNLWNDHWIRYRTGPEASGWHKELFKQVHIWCAELAAEERETNRSFEIGKLIYENLELGPPPSDPEWLRELGTRLRAVTTAAVAERAAEGGEW